MYNEIKCKNMALGVDTSKWKPRKLAGTPANRISNIIAAFVLGFGLISGAFYQFSGVTGNYRKSIECFYTDPIEEIERKQLIASGLAYRTSEQIRSELKEEARTDTPDK